MTEREEMFNAFSDKEKEKILGKEPTKLFYKFNDFEYKTESKPRILSGIKKLDYMLKGFELGCITLWSGRHKSGAKQRCLHLLQEKQ